MIRLTAERTPAGTSYLATGQGQPVVLIHGVGLNKEMWGGQVVGLATKYHVISYDMLGHGASPRPAAGTPLLGYADQLLELLDHLQVPQATVIGFSMGGLVARAFALH
ncbi:MULTISPECIES: alpha/beta fold hydrolase, partial [unclassified Pseudomonas]